MKVSEAAKRGAKAAGRTSARAKPHIKRASEAAQKGAEAVRNSDFSKSAQRSLAKVGNHRIPQAFADTAKDAAKSGRTQLQQLSKSRIGEAFIKTGEEGLEAARKRPRLDRALTSAENCMTSAKAAIAQRPKTMAEAQEAFKKMKTTAHAKMPKNGAEAKEALGNFQTGAKRKASELHGKLGDVKRGSQDKASTTQKRVKTFAERQANRVQKKVKVEGRGVAAEFEGLTGKFDDMFGRMKAQTSETVGRGRTMLGDVTSKTNS